MFGAIGRAPAANSFNFTAQAAIDDRLPERLGLGKQFRAIRSTRGVTKDDMVNNTARPDVRVDPDTFTVTIDGETVTPAPVAELPLAQRYFLF